MELCPNCDKDMKIKIGIQSVEYKGILIKLKNSTCYYCKNCDLCISTIEQAAGQQEEMLTVYNNKISRSKSHDKYLHACP